MQPSNAERAARAALVSMLGLALASCYYKSSVYRAPTGHLELNPTSSEPMAPRLDVEIGGDVARVTSTRMCAKVARGSYVIDRWEEGQLGRKKKIHGIFAAAGVAMLIGGYALVNAGSPYWFFAPSPLVSGAVYVLYSAPPLFLPGHRRKGMDPLRYPAYAVPDPDYWEPCGQPVGASVPIAVEANGGGYRWQLKGVTAEDGTIQVPTAGLSAWASACGSPVVLNVTLRSSADENAVGMQSALDHMRWQGQYRNVAELGEGHAIDAIIRRESNGISHLELGDSAGVLGQWSYPARPVWTQVFAPGVPPQSVPSATQGPYAIAGSCLSQKRQDYLQRCEAPHRASVASACAAECVSKPKQNSCKWAHDLCIGDAAGIAGSITEKCDDRLRQCMAEARQDASSIASCTSSCERRRLNAVCP